MEATPKVVNLEGATVTAVGAGLPVHDECGDGRGARAYFLRGGTHAYVDRVCEKTTNTKLQLLLLLPIQYHLRSVLGSQHFPGLRWPRRDAGSVHNLPTFEAK